MYFAHSGPRKDKSDWQELGDHLNNVSSLAGTFGEAMGIGAAARIAGLLHDLGKYTSEFQRRLEGENIRVDHSTAGAAVLLAMTKGLDRQVAELIAYGIAGHHAGLPDKLGEASLSERLQRFVDTLDPVWKSEIAPRVSQLAPDFSFDKSIPARLAFQLAFLGRMIFSCLVDADFKDTEAFYNSLDNSTADRNWPALEALLPQFSEAFEAYMAGLPRSDTDVNRLRGEILSHVRGRAAENPGLFTLTATLPRCMPRPDTS